MYFVSDLLDDRVDEGVALSRTPCGERAYRILCAEGHVFLLTNKGLYAFVNLAARFLNGDPIVGRTISNG